MKSPTNAASAIALADLPRELRAVTGTPIPYRLLYGAAVDGRIPAVKRHGRWYVARADLQRIAQSLADVPAAA